MSALAPLGSSYISWQDGQPTAFSKAARDVSDALADTPLPGVSPSVSAGDLQRIEQPLVDALIGAENCGISVKPSCLYHALRLAQAWPTEWPTPDVVVEPDGDIAFDWNLAPRRVLTVAVGTDGRAGFSALIGHEPVFGKVLLTGGVPKDVAYLMGKLLE